MDLSEAGINQDEILDRLADWDAALDAAWSDWRTEAKLCYAMVAGDQWDPQAKAVLEEQGRAPLKLNRIDPVVSAIAGANVMSAQEVKFYPREVGDVGLSEMISHAADWIRDECDAEDEEADAFVDCLVCGVGVTETRLDFEDRPGGQVIIERVDPLEMAWDATSDKRNFADARYLRRRRVISRDEFDELYPEAAPDMVDDGGGRRGFNSPGDDYSDAHEDRPGLNENEVVITEWQWWEREAVHILVDPITGQAAPFTTEQREAMEADAEELPFELNFFTQRRKVWRRAIVAGGSVLEYGDLPDACFTYEAITGKRDQGEGVYYGVVRAMIDPQRLVNKLYTDVLQIIAANAKGGVLVEMDAVEDPRDLEESWAAADAVTWVTPGALSGGKVSPKSPPPFPVALFQALQIAVENLREVSGVNAELLGMTQNAQAGVLESTRIRQSYGVLSAFFQNVRRYRKRQGRLLLKMMRFLGPETLIRVADQHGVKYVPLIMNPEVDQYDVVVDQAPDGPDEREKVYIALRELAPLLAQQGLPPAAWVELVRYLPLPESLTSKLAEAMTASQQDPEAQAMQQAQQQAMQLKMRGEAAKASKDEASAAETQVDTFLKMNGLGGPIR